MGSSRSTPAVTFLVKREDFEVPPEIPNRDEIVLEIEASETGKPRYFDQGLWCSRWVQPEVLECALQSTGSFRCIVSIAKHPSQRCRHIASRKRLCQHFQEHWYSYCSLLAILKSTYLHDLKIEGNSSTRGTAYSDDTN